MNHVRRSGVYTNFEMSESATQGTAFWQFGEREKMAKRKEELEDGTIFRSVSGSLCVYCSYCNRLNGLTEISKNGCVGCGAKR